VSAYAFPGAVPERQIDPPCDPPAYHPLVAVNPDCLACDHADALAVACGCGRRDWYCRADCRRAGEHVPRGLRICLHVRVSS
jgi:hypothetical protein